MTQSETVMDAKKITELLPNFLDLINMIQFRSKQIGHQ